jgi:hypothetical protein
MNEPSEKNDDSGIREKLAHDIGEVPWSYLAPHAAAGSLVFVDPMLTLEDVGFAISMNDSDRVQHWLKLGDLVKVEPIHAAQWEDGKTQFEALVVLPFVLCRPA